MTTELIVTISIAAAGYAAGLLKVWQSWSVKQAKFEIQVVKEFEQIRKDFETVKSDRAKNVEIAMARIEKIEKARDMDIKELHDLFAKSMEKIERQNLSDHKEITCKLESLHVDLTDLKSTFVEYRKTRNGNTPPK